MQLPANLYILTSRTINVCPQLSLVLSDCSQNEEEIVEFSDHEIASLDAFVSLIFRASAFFDWAAGWFCVLLFDTAHRKRVRSLNDLE